MCNCTKTIDHEYVTLTTARDRVAMCHLCPHADTGTSPYRQGVIGCTLNGRTIVEQSVFDACPLKRIDNGIMKWSGLDWYGVPFPIRLFLRIFHPDHPKITSWNRCGCIKALKDLIYGT